jgi:nicotinate-nucleotide adenylyltransferase
VFLIGADQFCDFLSWQEPDEVLERTRIAVATRPGFPRERLEGVLAALDQPERVLFFEIEPIPVASSDLRRRFVDDEVPSAVAEIVHGEGLYAS